MLEDLGNIGEFVGQSALSILCCIWPGEVRRNSRIQLRANHRASQEELHNSVRPAAENAELAALITVAMEDLASVQPAQRCQLDMYMMCWLENAELMVLDYGDGLIKEETLLAYRAAIAGHLRTPGGKQWLSERRAWFTEEGQRAFDNILTDDAISGLGAGVAPHHS